MVQPHDDVGQTPSGFGLLGIVWRDEHAVMCHECGRWLGGLSWHITKMHDMTVAEYREKHQLPAGLPLVSLGTSKIISKQSKERIGSPAWQRFEARRNETNPESHILATQANKRLSAGTRSGRAKRAAALGGAVDNNELWDKRLDALKTYWERFKRTPRQTSSDDDERRLAWWWQRQWNALKAQKLSAYRRAALLECGVPSPGKKGSRKIDLPA